jgi:PhnB protein
MKTANPYLNFPGNAAEAFTFYKSVFGGEFSAFVRFRDFGNNAMGVPEADLDKLAHVALPLGQGNILMATDVTSNMPFSVQNGNNLYISLEAESAEEARTLFDSLSAGGEAEMPLQKTEWAEQYGSLTDRFGIRWMVNYTGNLHFSG